MSGHWVIVDPSKATVDGAVVVGVNNPQPFSDDIDFEQILEDAFSADTFDEWRRDNPVIIVARGPVFDDLQSLMAADWGDVPEGAVIKELMKHAIERNAVCLTWKLDN